MLAERLPPGSRLPPLAQVALYAADPLGTLERWAARFGDTFTAQFAGLGRFVFTSAPAHIRAIFTADPEMLDAGAQNRGLTPLCGARSLLTLEGAHHVRQRRLMLPLFHGERVRAWADAISATTVAAVRSWPHGRRFALSPRLGALTLEVT